jgi:hypothetical protein
MKKIAAGDKDNDMIETFGSGGFDVDEECVPGLRVSVIRLMS